jgi:hypothetical protein
MAKFTFMGITTKAKTLAEAKAKVEEALSAQLTGTYHPVLIRVFEHVLIIWRQPESGWTYRILDNKDLMRDGEREVLHGNTFSPDDRDATERRARRHLAQMIYDHRKGVTGEAIILEEADKREHLSWVKWQNAYAAAKARGADDELARDIASGLKPMLAEVPATM